MSATLKELIEAKFTFIAVETQDVHLVPEVLESILPDFSFAKLSLTTGTKREKTAKSGTKPVVFYLNSIDRFPDAERIKELSKNQETTLLINYDGNEPSVHFYGFLGTPNSLVSKAIRGKTPDEVEVILKAVAGLSYTQAKQLIRLADNRGLPPTYAAYNHLRTELYGSTDGIYDVDVSASIYKPAEDLDDWFTTNRAFMFSDYRDLAPRGVLLHGVGGTGKTEFAKYISHDLKVPLYRLDIGSSLSRWQGESEANVRACLKFVDANGPCVLLIDEIEKAMPKSNSEESSLRILGHLLWWLQEHQTKVFTVMTVNDKNALPPELYRSGRCDAVFELKPITNMEIAYSIVVSWFDNWRETNTGFNSDDIDEACEMTKAHFETCTSATPADVVNRCRHFLRLSLAKK